MHTGEALLFGEAGCCFESVALFLLLLGFAVLVCETWKKARDILSALSVSALGKLLDPDAVPEFMFWTSLKKCPVIRLTETRYLTSKTMYIFFSLSFI